MTYQDQRNDDHPEAVSSDPVPVQRSGSDDEFDERDTDGDGVAEAGYHDSVVAPDQDDDRVEDVDASDTADEEDPDQETEDEERTGYDEPVLATPVDTDADRAGIDSSELDRERDEATDRDEETDRDGYDGPVFPDSALTPVAFGAATAGGAAAAAAMATNRTDTRTDAEAVEDRTDEDRTAYDRVDEDRVDDDRVDEDRVDDVPVEDDLAVVETEHETDHAADEHTELMPGEVDAEPVSALVAVEAAQGFRDRWREVQLRFVDDPRGAAGEAQGLAEEAADALVAAVEALRTDLGGWEATEGADTEHLRVVVRRYRDFLDRMLQS